MLRSSCVVALVWCLGLTGAAGPVRAAQGTLLGVAYEDPAAAALSAPSRGQGEPGPGTTLEVARVRDPSGLTLVIRALQAASPLNRSLEATIEVSRDCPYEVQSTNIQLRSAHEGHVIIKDAGPLTRQFVYRPWTSMSSGATVEAHVFVKSKPGLRRAVQAVFGGRTQVVRLSAQLPEHAFSRKSTVGGSVVASSSLGTSPAPYASVRLESDQPGMSSVFFTGRDGMYWFYGVPPGRYKLTIEWSGRVRSVAITVQDQPITDIQEFQPIDVGLSSAAGQG